MSGTTLAQTKGMERAPGHLDIASAPLAILFNPRSGQRSREERLDAIRSVLEASGRRHTLIEVEQPQALPRRIEQAVALAREQHGIVVASGGDGTINAVVQAAVEADLPFAALPGGTFNYFARLHGLPLEPAEAMRLVLEGSVRPVQLGRVNGRVFLVNASVGLYPKLLEDREAFKQRYGRTRPVALLAGLATLLRERRRMLLKMEHAGATQLLQTSTLFVGNNRLQLESVGVPEADDVQEGRLAAVVVKPVGHWEMVGLALRGAIGRLGEADQVVNFSFRRLDVQPIGRLGLSRVKVAFDGETAWMRWPLHFEVSPRPLKLIKR